MTQSDTEYNRKLFSKYNITSFQVYRFRKKECVKELIIKNY